MKELFLPFNSGIMNNNLKDFLEEKYQKYNTVDFIESDPIAIPHRYSKKEDIEIAAFFASTLAWGQRPIIIRNALELMNYMDDAPYSFTMEASNADLNIFNKFVHRTFNGEDVKYFIRSLRHIYKNKGGLEKVFCFKENLQEGLIGFRNLFTGKYPPGRTSKHIPSVLNNSSAKRLNMFLRWMVRKDAKGVDFGIWKSISPSLLYCPLDLHSGRVARKLGLLNRKQDDWKAVCELTAALRNFDSSDPVKYDFALFGLGIFENF